MVKLLSVGGLQKPGSRIWEQVSGLCFRSQRAFCAMLATCSCNAADGQTHMQTCRMTVRWDKAIVRYSSRVSTMVIKQLLGSAEIIQAESYRWVVSLG